MTPLPASLEPFGLTPIEIRDVATESVVDRTVMRSLDEKFHELGSGDWLVTALLPTGKRVTQRIKSDASDTLDFNTLFDKISASIGESIVAALPSVTQISSPPAESWLDTAKSTARSIDWGGLPRTFGSFVLDKSIGRPKIMSFAVRPPITGYMPEYPIWRPDAQLRFFRGSVLGAEVKEISAGEIKAEDVDDAKCVSDPTNQLLIVQLLQPDLPGRNMLLPPGATLRLLRHLKADTPAVNVAVSFGDPLTDQAVRLRARSSLSELAAIARSLTDQEVYGFGAKPIGAAICLLYLLLRERTPETVELALKGLPPAAAGSADVTVIQAELAARAGDHRTAVDRLFETMRRGMPYFGQGLTNLTDRLHLYETLTRKRGPDDPPADITWSAEEHDAVKDALRKVTPFSANCDFSAPVTTYSGLHPAEPGAAPLSRDKFLGTTGFPISLS
jgi:hypothetical protein